MASVHEMTDGIIHRALDSLGYLEATLAVIGTAWLLGGIALVLAVTMTFWRFLMHLPRRTLWQFLVAGGLYLGGAVGVEVLGNHALRDASLDRLVYELLVTLEESLEMFGIIVFIHGLLCYMAEHDIRVDLSVVRAASTDRIRASGS